MPDILVIKPGMLTTVQDLGRWGLQARGVPVAGPMDPWSHRLANALVGNDRAAATLEITLLGPELEFEDERAGGRRRRGVRDRRRRTSGAVEHAVPDPWRIAAAVRAPRAGRARVPGDRRRHCRARPVLGSRATHVVSGLGGFAGRPLKIGDRLPLGDEATARGPAPALERSDAAVSRRRAHGARVAGPARRLLRRRCARRAAIGSVRHRAELGPHGVPPRWPCACTHARGADIISDATPLGVLQVPASGQPILLMADRPTAGGYPKIATVISADMAVAGQLSPGDSIRVSRVHDA